MASTPALNFSDITSGPKTGNTDGTGSGAIVTIWGNNLGATKGTSKVYVGSVEATDIYYWKNADGTLPGGPADLYTYHKMQEIAFAVPAGAVDGSNTIKVTVGGVDSNSLSFTVRTGNIKFIKSTGNDSTGTGSWSSPYLTLQNVFTGGNGKVSAGDIIYSVGVGTTSGVAVGLTSGIVGTSANPVAMIAYPNTTVAISGTGGDDAVIAHYYANNRGTQYITHSKLKLTCYGNFTSGSGVGSPYGVAVAPYARVIGTEITGPTVYGGYGGTLVADQWGYGGGGKFFGLYIHHYGYQTGWQMVDDPDYWDSQPYNGIAGVNCTNCLTVDRSNHLFYLSNRSGSRIPAYEIAWGYFTDNPQLQGIHVYDQDTAGGWTGTMRFYNNVIKNQRGYAIDIMGGWTQSTNFDIFNNIIISDTGDKNNAQAIMIGGLGTIKVYNNTVYGWKDAQQFENGTTDLRNNIFMDSRSAAGYFYYAPTTHTNNLFYSTGSLANPSWYSSGAGDKNANPLFTNAGSYDFSLTSTSPARSAGTNVTLTTAPTDFFGQTRVSGSVSMGAIEYDTGSGNPPAAPTNLSGSVVGGGIIK